MARIRTIKPGFFRHHELYLAEQEEGLPLRIAFAGLWSAADRAGRFRWRPDELKLDCLPYDQVDFRRVLHALSTRGFIERYSSAGQDYGWIPSWSKHQVINNRERPSELPDPLDATTSTRAPRVHDACPTPLCNAQGEGEGEGEREGKKSLAASQAPRPADSVPDPGPPKAEKPKAEKPKDEVYELFASEFARCRQVPYRNSKGDFVQLAGLRKHMNMNGRFMGPWRAAVRNYFASPLSKYSMADLCVRFDVFLAAPLDRYGKPVQVQKDRIGENDFTPDPEFQAALDQARRRALENDPFAEIDLP